MKYISLIPYSDGYSQIMSKLGKQFKIVMVHNNIKRVVHGLLKFDSCTLEIARSTLYLDQGLHPKIILFFVSKSFFSCPVVFLFPCYTDILVCIFGAVRYRCHPQCMLK